MAKIDGKMTYVLTNGVSETNVTSLYTSRGTEITNNRTSLDTSVNPIVAVTGTNNENFAISPSYLSSAMFMEIRNAPHISTISNDYSDKIGNRILPTNDSISTYATCTQNCSSSKIKVYDSTVSSATTNRLFRYGSSDYPSSNTVGLDIDTYDYFILINPDIIDSTTREDSVRPHFAKITKITTFDEFGDGLEFEPKYPSFISQGTKFEIFKGPIKTDTSVVAVSYGLRGDASASTKKYDELCIVNRPTFYFYNDRLEVKDQLDYAEKYNLTSQRWWLETESLETQSNIAYSQYDEGSTSKYFEVTESVFNRLCAGMSIFSDAGVYLGNIEQMYALTSPTRYRFFLDYARVAISAASGADYKIGKTVQNVAFVTQGRYRGTIPNIGRQKLDAILVDNNKIADDSDSNLDPIFWDKSFTNMKRDSKDEVTNSLFNTKTAPSRYITLEPTTLKTSNITSINSVNVNSSSGKISKLAQIEINDLEAIYNSKIKLGDDLKIYNSLTNGNVSSYTIPHKVTYNSTDTKVRISNVGIEEDYKKSSSIKSDTIVLIEDYFYIVDTIDDRNAAGYQEFTTKARRLNTSDYSTWSVTTNIEYFDDVSMRVARFNDKFRVDIESDTEVDYDSNNRLTINNVTIEKENTSLYNSILNVSRYNKHNNYIDYVDKKNKLVTLQTPDKLYQTSNINRFYYYDEGGFSINKIIFDGYVESAVSNASVNAYLSKGGIYYEVEGRDKTANLLTDVITEDLQFTEDIIHSSLNPIFDLSNTQTATGTALSGNTVVVTGDNTLNRYTLLFDNNGNLIGEVNTSTYSSPNTTHTLYDDVYVTTLPNTTIKYHYPFSDSNYISGTKALMANPAMSERTDDFQSISEKGLVIESGFEIDNSFAQTDLVGKSNSGKFNTDLTLGFDLASPKAISTDNDSHFAFKLTNENLVDIDYLSKTFVNAEMFDVVETIKKDDNTTTLSIAPRMPIVMGRIEANTSDSRSSDTKMYLLNTNISEAGFIHRLHDTFSTYVSPKDTIRYWDLQRFDSDSISSNLDSIYSNNNTIQQIKGYLLGYSIYSNGTTGKSISTTGDLRPIHGSNVVNSDYSYLTDFGFSANPPIHYVKDLTSPYTSDSPVNILENIDKKAQPYELFAVGDLFPYSKIRYNNLGYSSFSLVDMGILLKSNTASGDSISHANYKGQTKTNKIQEINFERNKINSASITANNTFRFGVIRLVEATFDWHFNPVDIESFQEDSVNSFNYQRYRVKDLGGGGDNIALSGTTMTNNTGSSLTLHDGDTFFRTTDGTLIATYSGSTTTVANGNTVTIVLPHGDGTYNVYRHKHYAKNSFKTFSSINTGLNDLKNNDYNTKTHLSRVLVAKSPIYTSNDGTVKFRLAAAIDGAGSEKYKTPSVFLPLISENRGTNSTFSNEPTTSAFHIDDNWTQDTITTNNTYRHMHMSRVLAAHTSNNFDANNKDFSDSFGLPVNSSVYANCTAVFTDLRPLTNNSSTITKDVITSCPLVANVISGTDSYEDIDQNDTEQHSPTLLSFDYSSQEYAIESITTEKIFLQDKEGAEIDFETSTVADHSSVSSAAANEGEFYSANMFVKPKFDFSSGDISISGSTITINLGTAANNNHTWMEYMPNLTGHYLVSETGIEIRKDILPDLVTESDASYKISLNDMIDIHPRLVLKIISHTKTAPNTSTSTPSTHTLTFDKNISNLTFKFEDGNNPENQFGNTFRLMRMAEKTFEDTETIDLNKYFFSNIGNMKNKTRINFSNADINDEGGSGAKYQEGLLSLYLPISVDRLDTDEESDIYLARRNIISGVKLFSNETKSMYITDGNNKQSKLVEFTTTQTSAKLTFDGKITADGAVSFGEIFTVGLPNSPRLDNIESCYIGTTFSIGEQTENYIEKISRNQNLDFNYIDSSTTYTGNIVSSVSSNTITCSANVTGISVGDVLYTNDGYLLGEVSSISSADIVLNELFYTPAQYDEIKIFNKKTYISTDDFVNTSAFDIVKNLSARKGMDYKIQNNSVLLRNLQDVDRLRKININHKKHDLISVNSDESLFDYANKVVVVGNGVRTSVSNPVTDSWMEGNLKTVTHIDSSIRTITEAKAKAQNLLDLYSDTSIRKITLRVNRTGLEMLEAGDIVSLDFAQRGIPKGDYIIFEISNLLSGVLELKVGTYNKTIAERLTELNIQQRTTNSSVLSQNAIVEDSALVLRDFLRLSVASIEYTITGTAPTANMGFDDTLGFGEVVGFETSTGQELADYYAEDNL